MRLVLFALLTVLPLIEIALLVKFGQLVGVWLTLVVVVGTAILGAGILQRQGFTTMMRTQEAMMDGAMMVMAGFFLILPGLITDTMGLLLLIPPVRHFVARRLVAGMFGGADVHVEVFERESRQERRPGSGSRGVENGGPVIEGDFERLDERTVDPRNKDRPGDKS